MSMSSAKPWVGSSTANLSLSDPRCNNDSCHAFYDAHQLSQELVSYYYQYEYGHFVTWYYLVFIGSFAVVYILSKWRERSYKGTSEPGEEKSENSPSPWDKFIALWRYFGYRRVPGWWSDRFGLPSMGMLAFLVLAVLYCLLLTFAVRPYYRQHRGYGSPPLAVRTGLMAIALTPLVIALSGKANLITLLTGIGHERLNVIHRWVGWICFILSVIHTVPFIVAPLHDGGYAALHKQFYKPGGYEYTGVPPLAMLFGLLLLSLPWIRHRFHEGFYYLHFWLAVAYVGLMFWHAGNEGDSWVYLWATITAWLLSILARVFWFWQPMRITQHQWLVGSSTRLKALPGDLTRLEVLAPEGFHWRPGQHCFLRFPTINMLDNHPFTIASARSSTAQTPILSFFVRSHSGFTQRLADYLRCHPDPDLETWVDGPYGGHHSDLGSLYDSVILVAGGSGISLCLPWLENFAGKMQDSTPLRTSYIKLVWSVRQPDHLFWIVEALEAMDLGNLRGKLELVFHITNQLDAAEDGQPQQEPSEYPQKEVDITVGAEQPPLSKHQPEMKAFGTVRSGRMVMRDLVAGLRPSSRTMIIGCGPQSLKVDLSNAAAEAQRMVFAGDVREVALWTETFGW